MNFVWTFSSTFHEDRLIINVVTAGGLARGMDLLTETVGCPAPIPTPSEVNDAATVNFPATRNILLKLVDNNERSVDIIRVEVYMNTAI